VQDLVSGTLSSTVDNVRADYFPSVNQWVTSLSEGLLNLGLQVYTPSDTQLYAYIDTKDFQDLDVMSEKLGRRAHELHSRWSNELVAKENIEAQLERLRKLRLRSLSYLSTTRPEILIELFRRRLMPTGPNGEPHPKLVAAVAELEFTVEQLESFEREWTLYLQKIASIRQEVRSTVSVLASSDLKESAALYSSTGGAEVLLNRLQAVQELDQHPSQEGLLIAKLTIWLQEEITFRQESCLMRHCFPFYPDAIQLGRIIFGDGNSKTGKNSPNFVEV
jgi:hypothetical protein